MVSAWSSHDLDDSNQESPYRSVRCLTNTRHYAAFIYKPIQQSHRAACLLSCLGPLAGASTKGPCAGSTGAGYWIEFNRLRDRV